LDLPLKELDPGLGVLQFLIETGHLGVVAVARYRAEKNTVHVKRFGTG
jgi:hypothetical protein